MGQSIENINLVLCVLFSLCYAYQAVYILIRFFKKMPTYKSEKLHRYAFMIAARNEGLVIGELIKSIRDQRYPSELIDIYIIADNCTDDTAEKAESLGATVYRRQSDTKLGKGYALNYGFRCLNSSVGLETYDGYFIFDADNVLDENYVSKMNDVFGSGYRIVTSYRNSKNFSSNWISAAYGLWFLREAKYLNGSRMILGTSCAVSGTGFLVSSDIIKKNNGWQYNLMTEDIEFTADSIIKGELIGYAEDAVFYDEQPTTFGTSWNQRMRWAKGFYQVFQHYGAGLAEGIGRNRSGRRFQCYDMLMTVAPGAVVTFLIMLVNVFGLIFGSLTMYHYTAMISARALVFTFANMYLGLLAFGALTLITERRRIYCSKKKQILYLFAFPVFMFTYLPISLVALFRKVSWVSIQHTVVESVAEVRR